MGSAGAGAAPRLRQSRSPFPDSRPQCILFPSRASKLSSSRCTEHLLADARHAQHLADNSNVWALEAVLKSFPSSGECQGQDKVIPYDILVC